MREEVINGIDVISIWIKTIRKLYQLILSPHLRYRKAGKKTIILLISGLGRFWYKNSHKMLRIYDRHYGSIYVISKRVILIINALL